MPSDTDLTSDYLHKLLEYREGKLFWKVNRGKAPWLSANYENRCMMNLLVTNSPGAITAP